MLTRVIAALDSLRTSLDNKCDRYSRTYVSYLSLVTVSRTHLSYVSLVRISPTHLSYVFLVRISRTYLSYLSLVRISRTYLSYVSLVSMPVSNSRTYPWYQSLSRTYPSYFDDCRYCPRLLHLYFYCFNLDSPILTNAFTLLYCGDRLVALNSLGNVWGSYWLESGYVQFTCFTSIRVQILTHKAQLKQHIHTHTHTHTHTGTS
jgi:hypothetical protein